MAYFTLTKPDRGETPLVVEVPHAGLSVPEEVGAQTVVPREAIVRDADILVDKLYEAAPEQGATLLVAHVSRYVVDLNRGPDDVDRATVGDHPNARTALQPRGVVWRMTTDGIDVLQRPLTFEEFSRRISTFHTPYHLCLRKTLEERRERHGFAVLLAAHSMPSVGRAGHLDPGSRRADVVPGTLGRSTADARLIDLVDSHFRAAGLSVCHDEPYRGGWTTATHGRPAEHVHAIQIELNRALYANESTAQPKAGDFERLQSLLSDLVAKVGQLDLGG